MTRSIGRLRTALRRAFKASGGRDPAVYVALSDGYELVLDPDDRLRYVVDGLVGGRPEPSKKG